MNTLYQDHRSADDLTVLTVEQMYAADAHAIGNGISGIALMERAGQGAAEVILGAYRRTATAILCGPGNNGGDGYVIARRLHAEGWPVEVFATQGGRGLSGDAKVMADKWADECAGVVHPLDAFGEAQASGAGLIVDALFGAGLARPIEGAAAQALGHADRSGVRVLAIDVPSGVDGDTGLVRGQTVRADRTVTFFRTKPGHHLEPGRRFCGTTHVIDIGIPPSALEAPGAPGPRLYENAPGLWAPALRHLGATAHKYEHGACVVASGGPGRTGAARLAARAALRAGAGLVTLAVPAAALAEVAASETSVMVRIAEDTDAFGPLVAAAKATSLVLGPGLGTQGAEAERTRALVLAALALTGRGGAPIPVVLDADALTVFDADPQSLFNACHSGVVMTPHEGEFARLFGSAVDGAHGKLARAGAAADLFGGVVILKGRDTVIAEAGGLAAINTLAPPYLATAGSGDVLAGIIAGQMDPQ
ncbi:MAG: NAD(P)H-hydrate epimerase, partial [Pseudomonadota bacterium]